MRKLTLPLLALAAALLAAAPARASFFRFRLSQPFTAVERVAVPLNAGYGYSAGFVGVTGYGTCGTAVPVVPPATYINPNPTPVQQVVAPPAVDEVAQLRAEVAALRAQVAAAQPCAAPAVATYATPSFAGYASYFGVPSFFTRFVAVDSFAARFFAAHDRLFFDRIFPRVAGRRFVRRAVVVNTPAVAVRVGRVRAVRPVRRAAARAARRVVRRRR